MRRGAAKSWPANVIGRRHDGQVWSSPSHAYLWDLRHGTHT
ncbi:hypothetical protein [Lentzea guizhouensis]|nr:hypothetical protein [Lentzea guizhouensis]